jgi:hypothetical protein
MGRPPAPSAPIGSSAHSWAFKARFRRDAFGWKSQPAITRIRQAVAEIQKVAKTNPVLAAEGAVAFLERVSPAIEQVDGSSGSIGTAVNHAIETLVPVIATSPIDRLIRKRWFERPWEADQRSPRRFIPWGEFPIARD